MQKPTMIPVEKDSIFKQRDTEMKAGFIFRKKNFREWYAKLSVIPTESETLP